MDRVNELTQDCFNALTQIRALDDAAYVSPDLLHQRFCALINTLKKQGPAKGFSERDVTDITYAIVALADEIAVGKPDPMRIFWLGHLLQLQYFDENVAGEGFFRRLEEVRRDPRRTDVLRVYHLCLLLGFQGQYAVRGGEVELMALTDRIGHDLMRATEVPDVLSPQADRPDDAKARRGGNPLLWISVAALALAVVTYVALRNTLNETTTEVTEKIGEVLR